MPFVDDPADYLADFGLPCVFGGYVFMGILDQADEVQDFAPAKAHSRQYSLRYASSQAVLTRKLAGTVNAVAYTVREAPEQVGDGLFSTVLLTKT